MSLFITHDVDRQELMALVRLREDKALVELLRSRIAKLYENLSTASDVEQIYRLQGKVAVMKEFLTAIEKSREVLERKQRI